MDYGNYEYSKYQYWPTKREENAQYQQDQIYGLSPNSPNDNPLPRYYAASSTPVTDHYHLRNLEPATSGSATTHGSQAYRSENDEAPINENFKVDEIMFVSSVDHRIGSIYFPTSRMRLIHQGGPLNDTLDQNYRMTFDHKEMNAWRKFQREFKYSPDRHSTDLADWVQSLQSKLSTVRLVQSHSDVLRESRASRVFIELTRDEYGRNDYHLSRGVVRPFYGTITQAQLNKIYNAAESHSNRTLRNVIKNDVELSYKVRCEEL